MQKRAFAHLVPLAIALGGVSISCGGAVQEDRYVLRVDRAWSSESNVHSTLEDRHYVRQPARDAYIVLVRDTWVELTALTSRESAARLGLTIRATPQTPDRATWMRGS